VARADEALVYWALEVGGIALGAGDVLSDLAVEGWLLSVSLHQVEDLSRQLLLVISFLGFVQFSLDHLRDLSLYLFLKIFGKRALVDCLR